MAALAGLCGHAFVGATLKITTLMPQQPAFALYSARVPGQGAIGADDAMAGNDNTNGIRAVGTPHGTHRRCPVHAPRLFLVAAGCSGRDTAQPGSLPKLGACDGTLKRSGNK